MKAPIIIQREINFEADLFPQMPDMALPVDLTWLGHDEVYGDEYSARGAPSYITAIEAYLTLYKQALLKHIDDRITDILIDNFTGVSIPEIFQEEAEAYEEQRGDFLHDCAKDEALEKLR